MTERGKRKASGSGKRGTGGVGLRQ